MSDAGPNRGIYSFGALYDMLFKAFPECRSVQGVLAVPKLANKIGRSHAVVYGWLNNNRITIDGAQRFVDASDTLTPEDFIPFLFTKS